MSGRNPNLLRDRVILFADAGTDIFCRGMRQLSGGRMTLRQQNRATDVIRGYFR